MTKSDKDAAFLRLARKRSALTKDQAREIAALQQQEADQGRARSAAELAIEGNYLSAEEVNTIEQDVWIQSMPARLGDYELVRLLGRGGMSAVFRARDVSVGKTVAVKVLLPQHAENATYLTRFRREAALAAKPSHPNTVQVFHYGVQDDTHFLVMEYVHGKSVASMVRSKGPLGEVEALDIAIRVARSLAEAHEYGVVHRDVKPSNIRVSKWGGVKLMDFGIAKLTGQLGHPSLKNPVTLGVIGTPNYMSPEQARGSRKVDHRTDMYSLGATLYHMLTGSPPYDGDTPQDILQKIATSDPPSLLYRRPDLSELTCAIVEKMTARVADDRFGSFAELIGAMEAARDQAGAARKEATVADASGLLDAPTEVDDAAPGWLSTVLVAALVVTVGILVLFGLTTLRGCRTAPPPQGTANTP